MKISDATHATQFQGEEYLKTWFCKLGEVSNTDNSLVKRLLLIWGYTKPKCCLPSPRLLKDSATQDQESPLPFSEKERMKGSVLSKAPLF